MNNIGNEERILKRYLKKKMSFNQESVVKFLITGLIGITLTACGGGGGGGSSSTPTPPIVKPEEPAPIPPIPPILTETITKYYINEGHNIAEGNFIIAGTVSGDKENLVGITATSANIENKASIALTGDKGTGISLTGSDLVNTGEILVTGLSPVGIKSDNYANNQKQNTIENKGNIIVIGDGKIERSQNNTYIYNAAVGIDSNGADVYNFGDITAKGDSVSLNSGSIASAAKGIVALNADKVENHGTIIVEGNTPYSVQSSYKGAVGLEVSGKKYYDSTSGQWVYTKAETVNSGGITVTGDNGTG
ncbi:MAG: hypothetical protein ACRC6B_01560, partial [Fusobacteriaceae bacterium]